MVRFRSFWMYPLLSIFLLAATYRSEPDSEPLALIWLTPLGMFLWTMLEYGLHRFVFHIDVDPGLLQQVLNKSHTEHHRRPRDLDQLFVQTAYGLVVSSFLYGVLYFVSGDLFHAAGVMTGIWAGFLYYEWVHYSVHLSVASRAVVPYQRKAHFYHHFTNPKRCFGVTSPLWDFVFGTMRQSAR